MQDTWFFGIPGRLLRNFKIATLLIVPLALAGLFAAALAKAPKMLDVTELDIQSNTFGSGTLYVRPDGIKWDIARHNPLFWIGHPRLAELAYECLPYETGIRCGSDNDAF